LATLAFALALAGCASTGGLAPQGQPIDADSLATSRSLGAATVSDAAFPKLDWWTTLGDLQLDALIDEALAGTPDWPMRRASQASAQAPSTPGC